MRCEVLLDDDGAERGRKILDAMISAAPAAGVECEPSLKGYRGDCPLLMTYGTGHEVRRPYWQQQRRRGGRCIGWDLGYWHHKANDTFTMRATLDTDHPPQFIRDEPGERWDSAAIELREDFNRDGPIILVGMGAKSARLHANGLLAWEQRKLVEIRKALPGREILFRPKRYHRPMLRGVQLAPEGPIAGALYGASLVVCRHSNVAIDACIAGIPVVCEDGAAAALYTNDLRNPKQPNREERLRFLRSLAWWQWTPEEALSAWHYLLSRL